MPPGTPLGTLLIGHLSAKLTWPPLSFEDKTGSMHVNRPARMSSLSDFNPTLLVALGFRYVTVQTAFTPTVTIDLLSPSDPATATLMHQIQPSVTLSGGVIGTQTIAPYGVAPPGLNPIIKNALIWSGVGAGAILLGVMLFGAAFFSDGGGSRSSAPALAP